MVQGIVGRVEKDRTYIRANWDRVGDKEVKAKWYLTGVQLTPTFRLMVNSELHCAVETRFFLHLSHNIVESLSYHVCRTNIKFSTETSAHVFVVLGRVTKPSRLPVPEFSVMVHHAATITPGNRLRRKLPPL